MMFQSFWCTTALPEVAASLLQIKTKQGKARQRQQKQPQTTSTSLFCRGRHRSSSLLAQRGKEHQQQHQHKQEKQQEQNAAASSVKLPSCCTLTSTKAVQQQGHGCKQAVRPRPQRLEAFAISGTPHSYFCQCLTSIVWQIQTVVVATKAAATMASNLRTIPLTVNACKSAAQSRCLIK